VILTSKTTVKHIYIGPLGSRNRFTYDDFPI